MKVVESMDVGQNVRQGDLFIEKIAGAEAPYEVGSVIQDGTLALGEVTGHAHQVAAVALSGQDLAFLDQVQEGLTKPIVFRDEYCRRTERRGLNNTLLVDDVVAKIHSRVPFCVVHLDRRTRVVPRDLLESQQHGLHEAITLPPGLYKVTQQVEPTHEMQRVLD